MTHSTAPETSSADTRATTSASILIADKFPESGLKTLQALGCAVTHEIDLKGDALVQAVVRVDPDILIVRGTKVPAAVFEESNKLSLVVRAGAGYDSIDTASASSHGVFVANCPGKNAIAVAELAWGLILSCDRRIPDQTRDLRAGTWDKKGFGKASGLYGRTLGVVGLGGIGREVAHRGNAFGLNVIAWSRSLTPQRAEAAGVSRCEQLLNLARMADIVSINVAATPQTRHLIDSEFCDALKPGAIVVNTSRGSVVDSEALARAVRDKGVRVGLDVFAHEPGEGGAFEDAIVHLPGVYGTHHVGASTDQAQEAVAAETVRVVGAYLATGDVPNCVNRAEATPATTLLTVRHLNQPGVLAHIFYAIGQAGINVEEMENIIYDGAEAACARIQLDDGPGDALLATIEANEHVLSVATARIDA